MHCLILRIKKNIPIQSNRSIVELIDDILEVIEKVQGYVQSVIRGETPSNHSLGVLIEDVLSYLIY